MTNWPSLRDAYGSAEPVEALLTRGDSDDAATWEELWSRLCHQGTAYTASYAALPRLAGLAQDWRHTTFVQPLFLGTRIVACASGPQEWAAIRVEHAQAIRTLHEVAERLVSQADDDTDFIYRVQALLATEAFCVWATDLEALADEELEFECPSCKELLLLDLGIAPPIVKSFDDASLGVTTPDVADPGRLAGVEARAHGLAIQHERPEVAARMLVLFGGFECPRCRFSHKVASALE
ncbi:hypothetical protein CFH99_18965 [Nocardioides aromaticivorans]|uniref:Uncharacterized protein n=1 Tax=Nocardioides aromaticivorans TaxID=200618 RepID=A0ABX7PNW0_9ACTN|nr:hypothetical protein [Nocardioides aromaticivorans]QSR27709.1 hypothetical protein CFH99_18965 [Nocardioides aromaticivorans]